MILNLNDFNDIKLYISKLTQLNEYKKKRLTNNKKSSFNINHYNTKKNLLKNHLDGLINKNILYKQLLHFDYLPKTFYNILTNRELPSLNIRLSNDYLSNLLDIVPILQNILIYIQF